jgi:hypothetical protein
MPTQQVIQRVKEELDGIMAAIDETALRQLVWELQEAADLQEKLALVKSWVGRLEERVRCPRNEPSATMRKAVVLERLEGYVEQVEGSTAYVTLKSQFGDELIGEYAADELAAKGITEGRRFRCETIEVDGAVHVSFQALSDERVTEDEEDAISARLDELLQGGVLDGDS